MIPLFKENDFASFNWKYSSIHEFMKNGYYQDDWGVKENIDFEGNFGE